MRRILWLLPVLMAFAAIQPWASNGEAKTQPLIISGGTLGNGAVAFYPSDEWYQDSWVAVDEPAAAPAGPGYDVYLAFQGPIEMAVTISEGSGEVLYPEAGLRHVLSGLRPGWYEISESNLAVLGWVIEQAETRKEFGTLPQSAIHASAETTESTRTD